MEVLQSEYSEIEVDHANTQEDIYGRVRGPEKSSRVRTFGLGVTPTMVFAKKSEGLSEVERREIESKHQLEFEKYNQEMEANYERKKVEMEAQMENKVSEKVAAMQVELERKMHAKLQEKIDAYLDSLRFSPESPQDVSSGTGQVPEDSVNEQQTQLNQKNQEIPQQSKKRTQDQRSHQAKSPLIISTSQLLNYKGGLMAKKTRNN